MERTLCAISFFAIILPQMAVFLTAPRSIDKVVTYTESQVPSVVLFYGIQPFAALMLWYYSGVGDRELYLLVLVAIPLGKLVSFVANFNCPWVYTPWHMIRDMVLSLIGSYALVSITG